MHVPPRLRPAPPLLVFLVAFFIVWSARATVLYAVDTQIQAPVLRLVYSNSVKFGLWVLPVLLYLKAIDRVDPWAYLKLTTPLSRSAAGVTLLAVLGMTGVLLIDGWVRGRDLTPLVTTSPQHLLGTLATVAVSPILEEMLFRGFVLRKLGERMRFWQANLLSAVLFSAAHWPNWVWTTGLRSQLLWPAISVFVLGAFFGYLVKQTNSLRPSIAAHVVNNLIETLLIGG